jgi:hypothetical protein
MPAGHKPTGLEGGGAALAMVCVLHGISTKTSVPSISLPDIPAMTRYDAALLWTAYFGATLGWTPPDRPGGPTLD